MNLIKKKKFNSNIILAQYWSSHRAQSFIWKYTRKNKITLQCGAIIINFNLHKYYVRNQAIPIPLQNKLFSKKEKNQIKKEKNLRSIQERG